MMLSLPIAALMIGSSGCASYKVISADRNLIRLRSNQAFTPAVDGWFVPDARWLEINQALSDQLE